MLSSAVDEICKDVSLNLSGTAGKPVLPFASWNVLFLMQIYHDFHFVVAWFGWVQ